MRDSDEYEPVPSLPSDNERDEEPNPVSRDNDEFVENLYDSDDEKNGVEYDEEEQELYRRIRDKNN